MNKKVTVHESATYTRGEVAVHYYEGHLNRVDFHGAFIVAINLDQFKKTLSPAYRKELESALRDSR